MFFTDKSQFHGKCHGHEIVKGPNWLVIRLACIKKQCYNNLQRLPLKPFADQWLIAEYR